MVHQKPCINCGKPIFGTPAQLRLRRCCSRECGRQYRIRTNPINLSKIELAWLAGFIDGEGSIRIATSKYKEKRTFIPLIHIVNTDEMVINYIFHLIKAGTIYHQRPRNEKWSDIYRYTIVGTSCLALLHQIKPFLKLKGKVADLVLGFPLRSSNSPPSVYARQCVLFEQLKNLNHRGRRLII